MEYRFKSDEWMALPPLQRAHRCRLLAGQARELAAATSGASAESYLQIADGWLKLASEIESKEASG